MARSPSPSRCQRTRTTGHSRWSSPRDAVSPARQRPQPRRSGSPKGDRLVEPRTTTRQRLAKVYPVQVRLDAYERERLEELAAAWGVTLSAAIRRLIREATIGTHHP